MLTLLRRLVFGAMEVTCLVLFGAISIAVYSFSRGEGPKVGAQIWDELRLAIVFSVGFAALSGLAITAFLLGAFYLGGKPLAIRIAVMGAAFAAHVGVFFALAGSEHPTLEDLAFVAIGIVAVIATEVTCWRAWNQLQRRSHQSQS